VPRRGLEPLPPKRRPAPQAGASTCSATSAQQKRSYLLYLGVSSSVKGCVSILAERFQSSFMKADPRISRGLSASQSGHVRDALMRPAHTTPLHPGAYHGLAGAFYLPAAECRATRPPLVRVLHRPALFSGVTIITLGSLVAETRGRAAIASSRAMVVPPSPSSRSSPITIFFTAWQTEPNVTRGLSRRWLKANDSLVLLVPSAIVPEERNVLLNPLHPAFSEFQTGDVMPLHFDNRLLT
jgi:hypothetical protein